MHPDTDLVADILGQRPDAVPTPVRPPTLSPPHHTRPQQPPVAVARPGEENERPSHLPSFVPPNAVEADAQPLLPVPCGGQLIAKVNEVDTLFSPGELILLALLHCYVVGGVTHNLKFLGDSFVVVKPYRRGDRY